VKVPMKTTRKDFEAFKAEFRKWQKRLGLADWRACFEHGHTKGCYGEIFTNIQARLATVVFGRAVDRDGVLGYSPTRTGRHECLEMLLAEIKDIARARTFSEDSLDAAVHAIIRRLEALFDEMEENHPAPPSQAARKKAEKKRARSRKEPNLKQRAIADQKPILSERASMVQKPRRGERAKED
jgi:hypothetical protein